MKKQILSGVWQLYGYDYNTTVSAPDQLDKCQISINANVPGNVDLDLSREGFLPADLYMGENIKKTEDYEGYGWWYVRSFKKPQGASGKMFLHFEGVDCLAEYFLNGEKISESENMFIPHEFEVTDKLCEDNVIAVHLRSVMKEAYTKKFKAFSVANHRDNHALESIYFRKAPHSYGWDILPRAVSAGLFKDVYLVEKSKYEFEQLFSYVFRYGTDMTTMRVCYELDIPYGEKLEIKLEGKCEDSQFLEVRNIEFKSGYVEFDINNPKIWWPKGYGQPYVYDCKAYIVKDGENVAEYAFTTGIRTVKLEMTEHTDGKNGKFRFIINDTPVFCMGSNWVPLDAFHSRDKERYAKALELCEDIGCNILRVWGGGVYEQNEFYDYCDRHGIMVWQDFMMACHAYPQDDEFCRAMYQEAEVVIRMLRNHPSIILWSGDNECDYFINNVNGMRDCNRSTRQAIPQAIAENDIHRPYLPSSPYVTKNTGDNNSLPENHLWGVRDYYKSKFYVESRAHFVSETGYHGCPSRSSIEKFITPEKQWPIKDNNEWNLHSTDHRFKDARVRLMEDQITQLFDFQPDNLDDFVLASQYSQAEADKYFIERIRVDMPNKTGIIWWNILDGWPQMSDAVVDYYYDRKKAYNYIKRSMQPFFIMCQEIENWGCPIIASNITKEAVSGTYRISDIETGKIFVEGSFDVSAASNKKLCHVPVMYSDKGMFLIEWEINGKKYINHYLHGYPAFDYSKYRSWNEKLEEIYSKTEN